MIHLRKMLIAFSVMLLICSACPEGTEGGGDLSDIESELVLKEPYLGDVNKDGVIAVSDVIIILRHIVGLTVLEGEYRQRADVNLDGEIAVNDAIMVLRYIVGLVTDFTISDPAVVATERALKFVTEKTVAGTVALTASIELTEKLAVNRDITVNGKDNSVTGILYLVKGADNFTAKNLTLHGELNVNAGEIINIDIENNCDIEKVNFYSNAFVTGGGNIRDGGVWIEEGVNVDGVDYIDPGFLGVIDAEKSYFEYLPEIKAGTDILLTIYLRDKYDNPVTGEYDVEVLGNSIIRSFTDGETVIRHATITEKGTHTGKVLVDEVEIGEYTVKVNPAEARLYITEHPEGSDDGSGKTGIIRMETRDTYGNRSTVGLDENAEVTASLSEGSFTEESTTIKVLGKDGEATFKDGNLVVKGDAGTANLRILFESTVTTENKDSKITATTEPFKVLGLSSIARDEAHVEVLSEKQLEAGEEIKLRVILKDLDGEPVSGNFYTSVGEDWFAEAVEYDEKGEAVISFTQKIAESYKGVDVAVDSFKIGSFDITVTPSDPVNIEAADEQYLATVIDPDDLLDFPVFVSDQYGNPVKGVNVYAFAYAEKEDNDSEFYPFDGGTDVRKTDDAGIACFNDLQLEMIGPYSLVFDFDKNFDANEQKPVIRYSVIVWPPDSSVAWLGYDAPLKVKTGKKFFVSVFLEDVVLDELLIEDFDLEIIDIETGEQISRHKLKWGKNAGKIAPKYYYSSLEYTEEPDEPLKIEITIIFQGDPLEKPVPVRLGSNPKRDNF